MALIVTTWVWGDKYGPEYVTRLAEGLKRHLKQPYRFMVARPFVGDEYLTKIPGCFCRLRMFDPAWQQCHGIVNDDRIVCLDLDTIICGPLDPLFDRPEKFLILRGCNTINPCPYNGSVMMLRAGCLSHIWSEFSLEAAKHIPQHEFSDDQGWLWHKMPICEGWDVGRASGIYAFKKVGWPSGNELPRDARMVVFPGWRDPSRVEHLPWVQMHWIQCIEQGTRR